jgi:hypothetical protein
MASITLPARVFYPIEKITESAYFKFFLEMGKKCNAASICFRPIVVYNIYV